jgi:hypothetical protein
MDIDQIIIDVIKSSNLQNAEHFGFMNEVDELVQVHTPEALDVEKEYPEFKKSFTTEDDSFKIVRKSAVTKDVSGADVKRDVVFSGFRTQVKGLRNHFDDSVSSAAYRVTVLIDTYGNLSRETLDKETADIINLLQELKGKYSADIQLLGLTGWVNELEIRNQEFVALMTQRFTEESEKSAFTALRIARIDVDAKYRAMTGRINAGIIFNGPEKYAAFVNDINVRIARYNNTIAQRKGRAKANKAGKDETEQS